MAIPSGFLARFAIPMLVAALYIKDNGQEQVELYDKIARDGDKTLSIANKDGEATEFYDYIIIGGGSAGAVLAKRLTESGNDTVLLLEAGGDPNPVSDIPLAQGYIWDYGDMMLDYRAVPQDNACITRLGGACIFPRGKALGGSSSVNGLVYNRCNRNDYDSWANFTNDPIWRFDSVLDAFKRVENYHGFYEDNPGPNHGTDGELYVGKVDFLPGIDTFFEALAEKNISVGDLNSGLLSSGFSKIDYNIKDGLRQSTYHAFIEPILGRSNLKIYRYSWARKIYLDAAKKAVGVTYVRHNQTRYVGVNKEIILSAGVIDSPKLLLLSGIGPKEHLARLGIPIVLDLPAVGDHFQEHMSVTMVPFSVNKTFGIVDYMTPDTINEFVNTGSGPLNGFLGWSKFNPQIASGYIASKSYNNPDWPDIHVYIHEEILQKNGSAPEETFFCDLELVRTEQTGTVRLASDNPEDDPIISGRFFENPQDIERLIEGIEYMTDVFLNSSTYRALGIKWSENAERLKECEGLLFPSKEYWRCYVPLFSSVALHPTSTCRMGPDPALAVVDSRLRVFGTTGLRVIDSSVMPFVPNGNTNLPSIMIGEMGSRIILNQV